MEYRHRCRGDSVRRGCAFATMLIVFNLAVDVLYRWVDPRIE